MVKQRRELPWSFMVGDTRIDVHYGSGHWANKFNTRTGKIGDPVYCYETTVTESNGEQRESVMTQTNFRELRRFADDPATNVKAVQ